jgi:rSAM/selenodomain-associated transferase 1
MTICIFAKEPVAGQVKTRLAATIGDTAAVELASAFLVDTVALVQALEIPAVIAWSGRPAIAPALEVWPQGDGDLGERLERVLARALERSRWAIAIGTDSPGLPESTLRSAIDALQTHDAVVGPTVDGGYYLLGLRRMPPGLLRDIPWSTAETCARTVARLQEHDYRLATLPTWFDIDDERDLAHMTMLLQHRLVRAEATARALRIPT